MDRPPLSRAPRPRAATNSSRLSTSNTTASSSRPALVGGDRQLDARSRGRDEQALGVIVGAEPKLVRQDPFADVIIVSKVVESHRQRVAPVVVRPGREAGQLSDEILAPPGGLGQQQAPRL